LDLLEDVEQVTGDSTGSEPLEILVEGQLEEVRAESFLDLDLEPGAASASLGDFSIEIPDGISVAFALEELAGLPVPPGGTELVIPPFTFQQVEAQADAGGEFQWVRYAAGTLQVQITNGLPVVLGGDSGSPQALWLTVRRNDDDDVVLQTELPGVLPPDSTGTWLVDLTGLAHGPSLRVALTGGSPGSDGQLVPILPSQTVEVEMRFQEVVPDSALAVVDPQAFAGEGAVSLPQGLRISGGQILSGLVQLRIENDLPLSAQAILRLPDLKREGQFLSLQLSIPPGGSGTPGMAQGALDLAGARLEAAQPMDSLAFELEVQTEGSQGQPVSLSRRMQVRLETEAAQISLDWVEGESDGRPIDFDEVVTQVDLPEGLDALDFVQAALELELHSTAGLSALAELVVRGLAEDGRIVTLPVKVSVPPGTQEAPASVLVVLDETDSAILDLVNSQPKSVGLSGSFQLGTQGETGRVAREDRFWGGYRLRIPMRARVSTVEHVGDPFSFSLSEEDQRRIREDLEEGSLEGHVVTHLPVAATVSLVFSGTQEGLSAPELVLDPIVVPAAPVDPQTGRVTESRTVPLSVSLTAEDLDFFARDEGWGQVRVVLEGDSTTAVAFTASDYVEVRGILRARVRVRPGSEG
jgi:hypothetical protein